MSTTMSAAVTIAMAAVIAVLVLRALVLAAVRTLAKALAAIALGRAVLGVRLRTPVTRAIIVLSLRSAVISLAVASRFMMACLAAARPLAVLFGVAALGAAQLLRIDRLADDFAAG